MPSSRRSLFGSVPALLQLALVFVALCLVLSKVDLAYRTLRDQTIGRSAVHSARDSRLAQASLPFLGVSLDSTDFASTDLEKNEQSALVQKLSAAGFGWVRIRLAWDQIEPSPGDYAWQEVDRLLAQLNTAKLIPVLLLDGSPTWARAPADQKNDRGALAPPVDPATFARFAQAVALRYAAQVQVYQIWDEPNIAPHWGAQHIEPVNYARLLKAAATAIRAADTDAYILTAALAPTGDRGHLAQDEVYFLNRLYAAGAAPYFDALAIQPFGFATRPEDAEVDRRALNFRRALWIRQAMLDAGDADTPVWLVRYGWNRLPGSPWKTVSAQQQRAFAVTALEMAYTRWPWVVAMGWPAVAPAETASTAGFALTPELAEAFRLASSTTLAQPRPLSVPVPGLAVWTPILLWLLALAVLLWRGAAAARRLPWRRWQARWLALPRWQQAGAWALLLLVYYLATWPPLILFCWLMAALGFAAQPRVGLALALILLPFYDYHKEFVWLSQRWTVPPAQAVLFCWLPSGWLQRPRRLKRDGWLGVGLSWALVMALGAAGAWYWPAYWRGMFDLVIVPLLLFVLIRASVTAPRHTYMLAAALALGGLLVTGFGLVDWTLGGGTEADGVRRLTGPNFSSNHAALYLIRTLAVTIGLAGVSSGRVKGWWSAAALATGLALILTGSRGALLLGLPAAALFLLSRSNGKLPSRRVLAAWFVVALPGLALLLWVGWARLANLVTMTARMEGWIAALALWRDHLLFGVGPDGFWWSFPAQLSLTSNADPNLRHPHNLWLELATSGGLPALGWLLAVTALVYRWMQAKQGALSWLQVGLLAGLIAALAHSQVDAFQALPPLAAWNWAALALLLTAEDVRAQGMTKEGFSTVDGQSECGETKTAAETGSGL